jgi:pimeloyl-ACP methyl ester carboxylesterase
VRSLIVDAPIVGLSSHGNAALNTAFSAVDEHSEQAREWRMLHGDDWREAVEFYARTRSAAGFQDYYTLRPHLAKLETPTLICRGDLDDAVHPVDDAFVWHKHAPNTELWIAPGLSQSSVIQERRAEFVEALAAFRHRILANSLT